jgi:hypothetical protein
MPVYSYGDFVTSTTPLPTTNADQILGTQLVTDSRRRPEWVYLQFQSADSEYPFKQLRMPFADAMFLLSCLKGLQLDVGAPMPDDPRTVKRDISPLG